jgi:hypothetical protein
LKLYRTEPPLSLLAFDDARFGLKGELFVPSATQVLDSAAEAFLGGRRDRFDITFDSRPFDGWQVKAIKSSPPQPIQALGGRPLTRKALLEALGIDARALTLTGQYGVAEGEGTWYRVAEVHQAGTAQEILGRELWLCRAAEHYFPTMPAEIYLKVEEAGS